MVLMCFCFPHVEGSTNILAEIVHSKANLAAAIELHGTELNTALAISLNREDTEAHDQRDPCAELDRFLFVYKDT
jgi:hypothetical protein